MHWLNIHTATLDSEDFICSEPVAQGTWLKLLRYCAGQENGGVICGAKGWSDRQWQNLVRATLKEVLRECRLWEWIGDDLKVKFYPADKELEIQAKRRAAESTHAKRHAKQIAEQGAVREVEQPGKGKEGKEKEMEGKEGDSHSQSSYCGEAVIPSIEECILWGQTAGVSEDWIRAKHTNTTGTHGWVRNGKVILWRTLWKSWNEEDRMKGTAKKNTAAPPAADCQWPSEWNEYDSEKIRGIATGAAASGDTATVNKCRAWLEAHKEV
jgi:hypothetical protein